ncbi:MAG TPA: hypothetical protein VFO05_16350 [Candidatus Limnocylindrales bacterium]|nr:hypothetical protein [Candidatus Limnocylindrales bacterium]
MTAATTTLAAGGMRGIPVPDPVARDYLLLALRLDQHIPGLVDAYFGPADLKARVDMESLRSPRALADDADALRSRLDDEVPEPDRRDWLTGQLVALATQARALAGEDRPYVDHVTRCFSWQPVRRDDAVFDAAAATLDAILPGAEPLADRLAAWDARFEVSGDRVLPVVDWLIGLFRGRSEALFGVPRGEDLRVTLVQGQPWTAYNWYDGGLRSRVDLNTDLPTRAADLVHTVAHEAFPGHHLEHAWKEANLVDALGRVESSVLLINTPECLISEGLADVGGSFVAPSEAEVDLLVELYQRAGLPIATDPAASRDAAGRSVAMRPLRRRLAETRVNAALMRHADGASHDEVLAYLERAGRFAPPIAAKRLEFIEHPLWRTYVFVYHEGEALLRRWLDAVPEAERPARFRRLLVEQLTPGAIAAEVPETSA